MVVDNFDLIKNHLEFNKPGDFFHILIARRAKDVGEKGNLLVIEFHHAHSIDYFTPEKIEKFKKIADENDARVMINMNRKNKLAVAYRLQNLLNQKFRQYTTMQTEALMRGDIEGGLKAIDTVFRGIFGFVDTATGQIGGTDNSNSKETEKDCADDKNGTRWLFDLDNIATDWNEERLEKFRNLIKIQKGADPENRIVCEVPTRSGLHIITRVNFNINDLLNSKEYKEDFHDVVLHKNNYTILYIPEHLCNKTKDGMVVN